MDKFLKAFKKYTESEEHYIETTIVDAQHRIYKLLAEQNISKAELAKRLNVSRQQINEFFNKGHNATIKTLGKIAYALEKKVDICFPDKNVYNNRSTNIEAVVEKDVVPQSYAIVPYVEKTKTGILIGQQMRHKQMRHKSTMNKSYANESYAYIN